MNSKIKIGIGCSAVCLLALLGSGCTGQPVQAAAESAPPSVRIPVGPIPGPKVSPNLPNNPYTNNEVAIQEGRRLFIWYNCYGCHGGHAGGGMGPSLRDPAWRYGGDDAHIFASIADGRSMGMPAWGTKLPEDQIWKLVAYIKSMRTPQEADPPQEPPNPEIKEVLKVNGAQK